MEASPDFLPQVNETEVSPCFKTSESSWMKYPDSVSITASEILRFSKETSPAEQALPGKRMKEREKEWDIM